MTEPSITEINIAPVVTDVKPLGHAKSNVVGLVVSYGYDFEATTADGTVYAGTKMTRDEIEEWVRLLGGER